jgi:hypothetical protein
MLLASRQAAVSWPAPRLTSLPGPLSGETGKPSDGTMGHKKTLHPFPQVEGRFLLVGDEGFEPPTSSV